MGSDAFKLPKSLLSELRILKSNSWLLIVPSLIMVLAVTAQADQTTSNSSNQPQHQQTPVSNDAKAALEEELNTIVKQHDNIEGNDKKLAEAIISRLLVDNLSSNELSPVDTNPDLQSNIASYEQVANLASVDNSLDDSDDRLAATLSGPSGPEAMRFRKLLSLIHNYEATNGYNGYPMLPSSQAMKRATKLGNYLKQQHQSRLLNGANYARNNFDFGLGKRPDSSVANNILRYGDSISASSSLVQPVSQFGKRPSSSRYDFGLGKRVASPTYPRYDFGLGKRAPNYIRYDFGLGK